MSHADDGVHGGANFMAHVGQELALAAVGRLSGVQCPVQLFLCLFALSDVTDIPVPQGAAVSQTLRLGVATQPPFSLQGEERSEFQLPRLQALGGEPDGVEETFIIVRMDESQERSGIFTYLFRGDAVELLQVAAGKGEAGAPIREEPVLVDDPRHLVGELLQQGVALLQLFLQAASFRDLPGDPHGTDYVSLGILERHLERLMPLWSAVRNNPFFFLLSGSRCHYLPVIGAIGLRKFAGPEIQVSETDNRLQRLM